MKSLVYTATLTSALIFSIGNAQAASLPRTTSSAHSYLTSSAASPRNARAPFAKYHFGLQVSGHPLSQLAIGIPQNISFAGVRVTDLMGQAIQTSTTLKNQTLLINFMQSVTSNTALRISLNSLRTGTLTGRVWSFPVSEIKADVKTAVPLGIARIHTYN